MAGFKYQKADAINHAQLKLMLLSINQSITFNFLHQLMSQRAVQKISLKPQTAINAGVEVR